MTELAAAGTVVTEAAAAVDGQRYLTFTLHAETYAVDILEVTEIIEFRSLTVVPMMPPFIRGVINLRGRVLPVVDLASRFGQGETEVVRRTGVIVMRPPALSGESSDGGIGIMVDSVSKVIYLGAEDIEPPPAFGAGIQSEFISGMARCDGRFVIILDVARVLSVQEMVQLRQLDLQH
jgi:purine-binding chemotaxis protein CheW